MSDLDQLYQDIILFHAKAKHGSTLEGNPPEAGAAVGQSHQLNPTCGDEITLRVETKDGVISALRWAGAGCSISMASASLLTDLAVGESPAEFIKMADHFREVMRSRGKIAADEELLGDAAALSGASRYVARVKCAMLAWVAAEDALAIAR